MFKGTHRAIIEEICGSVCSGSNSILNPKYKSNSYGMSFDGDLKPFYGAQANVDTNIVRVAAIDLSEGEDKKEFFVFIQMNDLTCFILHAPHYVNEESSAVFADKKTGTEQINLTSLNLAKLLVGVIQLQELILQFKPITDTDGKEFYSILGQAISNEFEATFEEKKWKN